MNEKPLAIGNLYVYQRGESFSYADLVVGFNNYLERFLFIRISRYHGTAWYQEISPDFYEGLDPDSKPVDRNYHKDFIRFLFETKDYVWDQIK